MLTNSPAGVQTRHRTASQPASHGSGLLRYTPCHSQCRGCPDQEGVSWDRSWVLGMCWGRPHLPLFQIELSCTVWASNVNLVSSLLAHFHPGFGLGQGSLGIILSPPSPVSSLGHPGFLSNEMRTKETFELCSEYYGEPTDYEQWPVQKSVVQILFRLSYGISVSNNLHQVPGALWSISKKA